MSETCPIIERLRYNFFCIISKTDHREGEMKFKKNIFF